jgi:high-affinity nickel-transport protein
MDEMRGTMRRLKDLWSRADPMFRRRLVAIYSLLLGANAVIWTVLLVAGVRYPILLGLAPIAFGFGLRHAVDPDHIAAIDNTTRKLMQEGQRPVGVGFFFSLGHSTIVFALSVLIALSASFVRTNLPQMQSVGSVIGTSVSGIFLVIIAGINLVVLGEILKTWRQVAHGGTFSSESLEDYLNNRGLLARLFRPVLRLVTSSWQMYFVGLLFGLGFDTASEVGILGLSATVGAGGMPVWLILLLPLLFVAGMSLIDTTDGVAMLGAYGWAYVRPVRKLYYNLNITLVSVIIALFIGGVEVLQVISTETGLDAGPFAWANRLPLKSLGFVIIGFFVLSWAVSVAIYKLRGIDRWDDALGRDGTTVPIVVGE